MGSRPHFGEISGLGLSLVPGYFIRELIGFSKPGTPIENIHRQNFSTTLLAVLQCEMYCAVKQFGYATPFSLH
jgi:hypothetical protein